MCVCFHILHILAEIYIFFLFQHVKINLCGLYKIRPPLQAVSN